MKMDENTFKWMRMRIISWVIYHGLPIFGKELFLK
jgi:hypothetical protein